VQERPRRGETDPELLGRRRVVAEARREAKLSKAESSYEVRNNKAIDSVADCDRLIEGATSLRRTILKDDMDAWARYDRTKDLTADECSRLNLVKAEGPPDCPRPAEKDLWEMAEWHHRKENYFGWDVRGAVEKYLAAAPREPAAVAPSEPASPPVPLEAHIPSGEDGGGPTPTAAGADPAAAPPAGGVAPAAVKSAPLPVQRVPSRPARYAAELLADDDEWPWVRIR
jgi:hypothetical protein